MRKLFITISTVALLAGAAMPTSNAFARDAGKLSETDDGVRIYSYSRDQIYELVGSYGITTQIWTGADEKILSIQSGDSEAWDISVPGSADYVAVKPILRPSKPTNVVIYTDKPRVYNVALAASESTDIRDAVYAARFTYPVAVDSLDALAATLRELEETRAALETERDQRDKLSQQYEDLQLGYATAEQQLVAKRAADEQAARLASLEERLAYEERTRLEENQRNLALKNELDNLRASKDRSVFEVLESRLAGAEEARVAAVSRASELDSILAQQRQDQLRREEERLQQELAQARRDKELLRQANLRVRELEAQERAAALAGRTTVIFDAFDDTAGSSAASNSIVSDDPFVDRRIASRSNDQAFLSDQANTGIETALAVQLTGLDSKVLQGALLSGTLETAIDTSLSGQVRAILSEPIYSADGSRILADRASRLVGEYRSFVQFGTSRVLIAWNRLITTDGVSVELGSPGVDGLGRAGLSGITDTQFTTRFGAALLISILGGSSAVLVSEATDELTSETAQNVSDDTQDALFRVLEPYLNVPTTVHVHQGARINVFVTRDLDFTKVR